MPEPRRLDGRLVVVSNRVPGKGPAAGGLAVALSRVLEAREGLWFGWSGRHAKDEGPPAAVFETVEGIRVGQIDLHREDFAGYYSGFANSILWPAFHLRLDLARFEPGWYEAYHRVNARLRSQ